MIVSVIDETWTGVKSVSPFETFIALIIFNTICECAFRLVELIPFYSTAIKSPQITSEMSFRFFSQNFCSHARIQSYPTNIPTSGPTKYLTSTPTTGSPTSDTTIYPTI